MTGRLNEIGIMRGVLILFIVIGHTFAIYGLAESNSWPLPEYLSPVIGYSWINPVFISFPLQAFVFISGYLFEFQISREVKLAPFKYSLKRFKRLGLPLLIFGIAYMVIIEDMTAINPQSIIHLISGPGHLWFLPMLFWCCTLIAFIYPFISSRVESPIFLFLLAGISISSILIPSVLRINNAAFYSFFFFLGIYIYRHKESIFRLNRLLLITTILVLIIVCIAKYLLIPIEYAGKSAVNVTINLVVGVSGSILTLYACNKLGRYKACAIFGSWSGFFGVYLIHQFILKILYYKLPINFGFGAITPIVALVVTIMLSYALCWFLLKYEVTKKLIT